MYRSSAEQAVCLPHGLASSYRQRDRPSVLVRYHHRIGAQMHWVAGDLVVVFVVVANPNPNPIPNPNLVVVFVVAVALFALPTRRDEAETGEALAAYFAVVRRALGPFRGEPTARTTAHVGCEKQRWWSHRK